MKVKAQIKLNITCPSCSKTFNIFEHDRPAGISAVQPEMDWESDMDIDIECPDCGEELELDGIRYSRKEHANAT